MTPAAVAERAIWGDGLIYYENGKPVKKGVAPLTKHLDDNYLPPRGRKYDRASSLKIPITHYPIPPKMCFLAVWGSTQYPLRNC